MTDEEQKLENRNELADLIVNKIRCSKAEALLAVRALEEDGIIFARVSNE